MRLTPGAEAAWMIAAGEAAAGGHGRIEPAHLLIGVLSLGKLGQAADSTGLSVNAALVRDENARLVRAVSGAGLDPTRLRRRARAQVGRGPVQGPPSGPLSRSLTCKAVFAAAEAQAGEERAVGVAHLFAALAEDVDVVTAKLIRQGGADVAALRSALLAAVPAPAPAPAPDSTPPALATIPSRTPALDRFGRDLTALARRGELGPVIGRRREILAVVQALARSSRNNPVLVGEPGVGKTAIVEAIAIRAAEGSDPAVLGGKRIVELSIGALLGGTGDRAAFEQRVADVTAEACAHPEVIVFMDELDALVGAGRVGPDGLDAANILKPPLARGELRCIGATTIGAYRRFVEEDPALERRFEKVLVEEPDRDETLEILRGLRPRLEHHHGVSLPDETLAAAVDLSMRFETDRRLPDKAIDLVDKAAARTRLPALSLLHSTTASGGPALEAPPVTPVIVARVLAEKRRLPLDLVTETLDTGIGSRLLSLEGFLRERVLGQEEAIARVSRRLRLAFAAPKGRRGPMTVLLFLGPSGVGKTETARLLAEHLFGSASGMIRIDMSELMEEDGVFRLVGSPDGDSPFEEGRLTDAIRAKPRALLLLDEVEKAQPGVLDVFLRLFDEGRLTDSSGRIADGRSLVVVLTSNLGTAPRPASSLATASPDDSGRTRADLRGVFRLELVNRIDEIVTFRALDADDVEMIVGRALAELTSAVERRHGVRVRVTPEAARFAARQAALSAPGARGAKRTVERLVHGPLSALVLTGKLTRHTAWAAVYDEGGIYLLPEG
ncbi:MAG TPA: ATP-dependent Clp protease ATP-binding subunit [Vicinamibacteria bacterium]|nr:ATP-dependent Clp protease ATP-binding subunit [Vicinamibacteria bacterium]